MQSETMFKRVSNSFIMEPSSLCIICSGRVVVSSMAGYSIFGDSISTFRGMIPKENRWFYDACDTNGCGVTDPSETWWGRVIDRQGGKLVANASFSGAMVDGWGFPAGRSMMRARQVVGADGAVPDIVIVYMGINDYGWGSPEAQAAGKSVASAANYDIEGRPLLKPVDIDGSESSFEAELIVSSDAYEGVDPAGPAPDDAVERFRTAYEEMISNIKMVAPKAEVHCMTLSPARIVGVDGRFCYSLRGIELDDYNDAIERACKAQGARCADVRAFGLDYSSIDGTHPDLVGMRQLADMYMASMGDSHALDDYEDGMESTHIYDVHQIEADRGKLVSASKWSCLTLD